MSLLVFSFSPYSLFTDPTSHPSCYPSPVTVFSLSRAFLPIASHIHFMGRCQKEREKAISFAKPSGHPSRLYKVTLPFGFDGKGQKAGKPGCAYMTRVSWRKYMPCVHSWLTFSRKDLECGFGRGKDEGLVVEEGKRKLAGYTRFQCRCFDIEF